MTDEKRSALNINIGLLKVFIHAADCLSFSESARRLGISSSQVTRRVSQLEKYLKVRLFNRTTRSIRLTEAGNVVLHWARELIESHDDIIDRMAEIEGVAAGHIRIAVNNFIGTEMLPPFLAEFSATHPDITYSIVTTDEEVNLVEGQYDVAICVDAIRESSMISVCISQFDRILCASPGYLKAHSVPRVPQDLALHHSLMLSTNNPPIWHLRKGAKLVSQKASKFLTADNYVILLELAKAGLGIVGVSELMARDALKSGELVHVMDDYTAVMSSGSQSEVRVLFPSRKLPKRTRIFIDTLIKYYTKAIAKKKAGRYRRATAD